MPAANRFADGSTGPVTLALFGPQVTRWTPESLLSLQNTIIQDPRFGFIIHTLERVPLLWPLLEDHIKLPPCSGLEKFQELRKFAAGEILPDPQGLSNVHLAALTVVAHAVDVVRVANEATMRQTDSETPSLPSFDAVQGFCIGFLSAAVVSLSKDWPDFKRNASNAIRLAASIGAVVDAENERYGSTSKTTAVSVRWRTDSDRAYLETSLELFADAYVSCVTDEQIWTVTLPSRDQSAFIARLNRAQISTGSIGLSGAFHNSRHAESAGLLKLICAGEKDLQLPNAEELQLPMRSTADGQKITTGRLHDIAIDLILCQTALWFRTVKATLSQVQRGKKFNFVQFGKEPFVPRSLIDKHGQPTVEKSRHMGVGYVDVAEPCQPEEIAVIGMACRFPEANSVEEFWQLIGSGRTAFGKMPVDRFNPAHVLREPKHANFWGNFLQNPDEFDHRFFGNSAREAKSMDPQQRLALQVAYEALESSGYNSLPSQKQVANIGCYLGVGWVEYSDNVASENANAFSAIGTLRAFISGRVSHFFGWNGPSITFDTACSSSAVAIHTACKSLLNKECSSALAGGVNVITSPHLHQNLHAGSFLSPTGSSKAFDDSANGYCRGEGAGMLVLKPLSDAVAQGDPILGVISGSSVNQNSSGSPITVPDSNSQAALYRQALSRSKLGPQDVSYVEAHGTGTAVGDPIEYRSVQMAFPGSARKEDLYIGSVKDNIGHTEAASGVAAVIKCLLMMQHRTIPKQANFNILNRRIKCSTTDRIAVPRKNQPWSAPRRVALVNNYGAAGSNAAIVLREHDTMSSLDRGREGTVYPFLLSAKSETSLNAYLAKLKSYLSGLQEPLCKIAYNLAMKHDTSFGQRIAFTATDMTSLLSSLESKVLKITNTKGSTENPVVLCFGGQSSRHATLSKDLFDESELLQRYLVRWIPLAVKSGSAKIVQGECDAECQTLGLPSLFPSIFQAGPVEDVVSLHIRLFSIQFSCAKCWLDCGLEVDTLIGHSLGQLTALCVADSVSLKDSLCLISGRARLIRNIWGEERGMMLSVEGDREELESIIHRVSSVEGSKVDFACYNGTRSFVLSGAVSSIEKVEEACRLSASTTRLKTARLDNTHAYHSHLADCILPDLERLANSIAIQSPRINVETCSSNASWSEFTAEKITQHTRQPVYFSDAVERAHHRLPSAIWLEAGSASPVIAMVRRVLASCGSSDNVFIPLNLGTSDATANLADAICCLWRAGSNAQHWLFHRFQHKAYANLNLPPYQFERTRHWMSFKPQSEALDSVQTQRLNAREEDFVNIESDDGAGQALFSVNTSDAVFGGAIRGHAVAGHGICPASMYIELAARCTILVTGGIRGMLPQVEELTLSAPLGLRTDVDVTLRLCKAREVSSLHVAVREGPWDFKVSSQPHGGNNMTEHASGRISLIAADDPSVLSRKRLLMRLASISRANQIRDSPLAAGISGSMVYKIFLDVVEYATYYHGVQSLCGLENEAVGFVTIPADRHSGIDPGVCDPISVDNFLQVAGIHVNCLSSRKSDEVFMCTSVDQIMFSQSFMLNRAENRSWKIYTKYETASKANVVNDIFVFDPDSEDLVLTIIGANFRRVPFRSLSKSLAKLRSTDVSKHQDSNDQVHTGYQSSSPTHSEEIRAKQLSDSGALNERLLPYSSGIQDQRDEKSVGTEQLTQKVREMFSSILGIPLGDIEATSSMNDLGIDSLLVIEVLEEIQRRFRAKISPAEFQGLDTLSSICDHLLEGQKPEHSNPSDDTLATRLKNIEGVDDSVCTPLSASSQQDTSQPCHFASLCCESFVRMKYTYNEHINSAGLANFYSEVYPLQSELVTQYVVAAFASFRCDLQTLRAGAVVPAIQPIPRHKKLVRQLYKILQEARIVTMDNGAFLRTAVPIQEVTASALYATMLARFPKHASETKLLSTTAQRLADCLNGSSDPTALIFQNATSRALLEDVYTNAPMFKAGTTFLAQYLTRALQSFQSRREVKILEIGAGTGGTSKYVLERLAATGQNFTYMFTDLSPSMVAAAKRKFACYPFMQYAVVDVEKEPDPAFTGAYDIVIATNCIHATKDLLVSSTNIRKMLRLDGLLCLVELTRNLFWFDLVFGLLEGWWLFNDGRDHVLADEARWQGCLSAAGFQWIDWSDGETAESKIVRVIAASPFQNAPPADSGSYTGNRTNEELLAHETFTFKEVNDLSLKADIHYPSVASDSRKALPVALMIHGGGHIMLSRKDVRPEQIQMLLRHGVLPVSVDYRLCPEKTLTDGPMTDVLDALVWVRDVLPSLPLQRQDVRVNGQKVASVGWSTGGQLAMSLGWTSLLRGIQPPHAILAFYPPTDYEDPFWTQPNVPTGSEAAAANQAQNSHREFLWEGVSDHPIKSYNISPGNRAIGGWMAPSDPRSRIALYMNWHGRTLSILLNGLDKRSRQEPREPTPAQIAAVSPLSNIRGGNYTTPTFIVHPRQDDLIPWEQSQRTWEALRTRGVDAELRIIEDVPHLFDVYRGYGTEQRAQQAVEEGYSFLCRHVSSPPAMLDNKSTI